MMALLASHARDRIDSIRCELFNPNNHKVIVASHRGDWRNFPENSLEAIDNAISMGVDIVEIDVQRTKDSVLIVMHDPTLDRTTTGKGRIDESTFDYISTLRLKNGCNIRTIHKVPTLEEALVHAKGKIMVNLDKADRYFDQVYDLIVKTGTAGQIIMKGNRSARDVKRHYGSYLGDVIYMPIVNLDSDDAEIKIRSFMTEMSPAAFELLFRHDSNPLPLKLAQSMGGNCLIWYNTMWDTMAGGHDDDASLKNVDDGYGYLIDKLNAKIIQTDRPQFLLDYLRSRDLHD